MCPADQSPSASLRVAITDAIGRPLAITVMRNGALVDVIAEPSELVAA